jgi:hypothetical protein
MLQHHTTVWPSLVCHQCHWPEIFPETFQSTIIMKEIYAIWNVFWGKLKECFLDNYGIWCDPLDQNLPKN